MSDVGSLDQLLDIFSSIGDVGSIVRVPNGFQVRRSYGKPGEHMGVDIFNIELGPEHKKESPLLEGASEFATGWYQNSKAELFYYEGEGYWKDVGLVNSKSLTKQVLNGELEFIG
jgi:hypothetical protein